MGAHRDALAADFHRYYGRSLSTMPEWGIPLWEVAAMAVHMPPDSAIRRALDPHWQRTPEIDLLRDVEYGIRVLAWQKTKDGSRGLRAPQRLGLPWDPLPDGTIVGDAMTFEEADRWLGWDKLKGGS